MATDNSIMAVIRASRPTFRNPHDKVAFAVHASCVASGFVLLATGPSAFSDDPFSSASADEVGIDHWNDFEDNYAFIYSIPEANSKKVLIKCLVMNGKLIVDALGEGDSNPHHLELNVQDYVENGGANYNSQYKNFGKLVEEIDKEILSSYKCAPAVKASTQSSSVRGGIRDDPDGHGADSVNSSQRSDSVPLGYVVPPIPAFGGNDIFPAPGAGVYPTRDIGGHGGMLVGPRDLRFFPGIGGGNRLPGGFQGIPPGARFDPFGPPDVPGFEPGRFIRHPTRPGSGRNHPDLEHFGDGSDFI